MKIRWNYLLSMLFIFALLLGSCAKKPEYQTRKGKKKWERYNKTQYGLENKKKRH